MGYILYVMNSPPPYGGVRVSASIEYSVLSAAYPDLYRAYEFEKPKLKSMAALLIIVEWVYLVAKSKAVVVSVDGVLSLVKSKRFLLFERVVLLLNKPLIIRGFGGGIKRAMSGSIERGELLRVNRLLNKSCAVTFECYEDWRFVNDLAFARTNHIHWLPNTRALQRYELPVRLQARRFCFVGKVSRLKGAHHLISVAASLPIGVTIDIYGPMEPLDAEDIDINCLSTNASVRYCGSVEPERVVEVLKDYDALLLPTTWKTEGHPGVILEAFSVGLPVIATRWNGIPELVDCTCGLLIEPDSTEDLVNAICSMHENRQQWQSMRRGAMERLKQFDPEVWASRLHEWIAEEVS